jgi:NADH/NAD ratio-sensing transcriptional regulator Rex
MSQTSGSPEAQQAAAATDSRWPGEYVRRRAPPSRHATDAGEPGARTCGRDRFALVTVERLIRCHRLCMQLERDGLEYISAQKLSKLVGCTPELMRKDLGRLGKIGTKGRGYRIARLLSRIEELFVDGPVSAVLIGVAAPLTELLARGGFASDRLRLSAAFDFDPSRAGTRCCGLEVNHISRMADVLGAMDVDVGVLAVAETEAEEAARLLVVNGVRAILNLTPAILRPRRGVAVRNIDLGTELEKLVFDATNQPR